MQVIAGYEGENILLKKYTSYLELDRDFSNFHSIEELKAKLDFEDGDWINVFDNNKNIIHFDSELVRETISFYENKKGDEFVEWITNSSRDIKKNNKVLFTFFSDRLLDFTKGKDNFSINDINNAEGKRLYQTIKKIRNIFEIYGDDLGNFDLANDKLKKEISEYLKKDGEYNYGYMRKFVITLSEMYGFITKIPSVNPKEITSEEQEKVLEKYRTAIHNHNYSKKQITIENVDLNEESKPIYDENGIKLDEKEFLEEFAVKRNLHL